MGGGDCCSAWLAWVLCSAGAAVVDYGVGAVELVADVVVGSGYCRCAGQHGQVGGDDQDAGSRVKHRDRSPDQLVCVVVCVERWANGDCGRDGACGFDDDSEQQRVGCGRGQGVVHHVRRVWCGCPGDCHFRGCHSLDPTGHACKTRCPEEARGRGSYGARERHVVGRRDCCCSLCPVRGGCCCSASVI